MSDELVKQLRKSINVFPMQPSMMITKQDLLAILDERDIANYKLEIVMEVLQEASSVLASYSNYEWHETDLAGNMKAKIENTFKKLEEIDDNKNRS